MNIATIVIICLIILALVARIYYFGLFNVYVKDNSTGTWSTVGGTPGNIPGGTAVPDTWRTTESGTWSPTGSTTGSGATASDAEEKAATTLKATQDAVNAAAKLKADRDAAAEAAKLAEKGLLEAQKTLNEARTEEEKARAEAEELKAKKENAEAMAKKLLADIELERATNKLASAQAASAEAARVAAAEARVKADTDAKVKSDAAKEAADASAKAANDAAQKKAIEDAAKTAAAVAKTDEEKRAADAVVAKAAADVKEAADFLAKKQAQETEAKAAADAATKTAAEKAEKERLASEASAKAAEEKAASDTAAAERAKSDAADAKAALDKANADAKAAADKAAEETANADEKKEADRLAKLAADAKAESDRKAEEERIAAAEKGESDSKAEEERIAADKAKLDDESAKKKVIGIDARKIFYQPPKDGISDGFLAEISSSTTYPISLGIGALYQPAGVPLEEIDIKLRTSSSSEAVVVAKSVTVDGTLGSPLTIPSFEYPFDGDFTPLGTDVLVFLRPKNNLFDKIMGTLAFQKISVYNSAGRDVSNAFTPISYSNNFLPFSEVAPYLPAFCKTRDGGALNDIFKDSTNADLVISMVKNETGVQSLMEFSSTEMISDCFALRSSGVVVSTVVLEYNLDNIFSQLSEGDFSNGFGLFRHNIRSWINFCMANTIVCALNIGVDGTPHLLSYRTLGAMSLKLSTGGIRAVAFLPLVETWNKGVTFAACSLPGSRPSSIDTFLAPHITKIQGVNFNLSPIDESVATGSILPGGVTSTEVDNPMYAAQAALASRYYKANLSTKLRAISATTAVAASILANFASIPPGPKDTTTKFVAGKLEVSTPALGTHAVVVQSVPQFYKLIKRSFKFENSAPFPPNPLSLVQGGFTTSTTNPDYNTADKYHNLEEAFYEINTVTEGIEYSILPNSGLPAAPPGCPPEPLTVVIYGKFMEEIATFTAVNFSLIRVYVLQK